MNTIMSLFSEIPRKRVKKNIILAIALLFMTFVSDGICQQSQQNTFLVLTIDNQIISPVIADYISKGIQKAQNENYQGVIIIMDTPGGLLESTRAIVKKIMNATIPVITYVSPSGSRAGSAGVFITYASHIAAMAPSTNIGAAHPIELGAPGKQDSSLRKAIEELTQALKTQMSKKPQEKSSTTNKEEEVSQNPAEDKILNDTLAWITTIAKNRARNADWAREAVLKSASATEKEALEKKVINLIADDLSDLLKKIDSQTVIVAEKPVTLNTKNAQLVYFNLSTRQKILNIIINPNIAYILMLIGFLGIFIEITHPGVIVPGIVGVISLIVAFYAFALLPVNFAGFILIFLGIILFVAEVLTPVSFGVLTLGGAICMLLGSMMLIDTSFLAMKISLNIILPFILSTAVIVIFLVTNVLKTHKQKVSTGPEALIGQSGKAQTDMDPDQEGQVFVCGEIWTAINKSNQPIKKGEKIKVLQVDKIKLLVTQYKT